MTARSSSSITVVLFAALAIGLLLTAVPWRPEIALPAPDETAIAQDFRAADRARAETYSGAVRVPALGALLVSVTMAGLLGFTPLGARLIGMLPALGLGWPGRVFTGGVALAVAGTAVTLPFAAWAQAVRRRHGLATGSWELWLADVAKGTALTAVAVVVGGGVLLGLMRAFPRGWPLTAGVLAAAAVVLVSLLFPLLVEPLYARFTPLPPGPLHTTLMELARRDAVPVSEILVADASRRTNSLNAYVSGVGPTRRIVVYDTLLRDASAEEVALVVAHELGHAARGDVLKGSLLAAAGMGFAVGLLGLLVTMTSLPVRAGSSGAGDPRLLAFVVAVVTVCSLAAVPIESLVSRRIEARADLHALQLTRDPQRYAAMHHRLAVRNLSDPDPPRLLHAIFASHPTPAERIAFARVWAAAAGLPVPGPLAP